jgi:hypothetical protein
MPESQRLDSSDGLSSCQACLIVVNTTAVVLASPRIARNLYDHFRSKGLACSLLPGASGRNVIDFGSPSPNEQRQIRTVFASWQAESERGSLFWCAWLALLVIALWLLGMLARW